APAQHAGHRELAGRRGAGQVPGRRPGAQRGPRPAGGGRGSAGRAGFRESGRGGARRVSLRTGDRASTVLLSQCDPHSAPGRIAERDTRLLAIQVLLGVLSGHTEEEVNEVNAPSMAEQRGIELAETKRTAARDYTDLVRVTVAGGEHSVRVVGTLIGRRNRP